MTYLINIIGAGRLGKTIGSLLIQHQLITIGAIHNRSDMSTDQAIQWMGQGHYCPDIARLPPADITFITTPDDAIPIVCEQLSQATSIKIGSIILHCSGSLTSDVLISMKKRGCYIASAHPMRSFSEPEKSSDQYAGTYCALEGDKEALSIIQSLFHSIGSITYEIDKIKKPSYHAAGVFASNYVVTLAQQALSCMKEAGIEQQMAMHMITHIMRGTVSQLENTLSPERSLTGPIQRGDISTIMSHMTSLTHPEQQHLYTALAQATLPLTNHTPLTKDEIIRVLTEIF
jgi:predicted short-subunit dehydrogenase-like oxidoreductase (DUF2520 family)